MGTFFYSICTCEPEMKFILCTKHYLIGMGHWGKQLIQDCRNISEPGQLVSIFCGVVHKGVMFVSIYWEKKENYLFNTNLHRFQVLKDYFNFHFVPDPSINEKSL